MIIKTLGAAAALALLTTTAMAADLPSRRAPPVYIPPPVPTFTWTGLYVGGQVGYEFGSSRSTVFNNANGIGIASGSGNPNGVIGGAHVGYLYSMSSIPYFGGGQGSLVVGVEGDVDGSNYRGGYGLGAITANSRETIQGSARARVGIAVDRALFYATGGAAFGGLTNSYFNTATGGADSFDHTKVGYTVGGGVEYALTNNWSARVEYRYTDFGSTVDPLVGSAPGASSYRRETDNRVQAGISYKFDTFAPLAPVVARY